MLPVDPNEPDGKLYAPISGILYEDIRVQGFVYFNPSLKSSKAPTIRKKAEDKLKNTKKALAYKFKCQADAKTHYEKNASKVQYIKFYPETDPKTGDYIYEGKLVQVRRGHKSSNPELNVTRLKDVRIKCAFEFDNEAIECQINKECMYVLITTNVESCLSVLELSNLYKDNIKVEQIWHNIKDCRFVNKGVNITSRKRLEAFMTVVGLYLLATACLQVKIRSLIATGVVKVSNTSDAKGNAGFLKNPTIKTVMKFLTNLISPDDPRFKESPRYAVEYECAKTLFYSLGTSWESILDSFRF